MGCYKRSNFSSDDDIPEKLNQTFSKCMSQGILNFDDDMPEDGCVDTNKVFDKDILATAFESTFLDLFGVACTCPSTGCNDPRGRYTFYSNVTYVLFVYYSYYVGSTY